MQCVADLVAQLGGELKAMLVRHMGQQELVYCHTVGAVIRTSQ